jgi:hypothetical protein
MEEVGKDDGSSLKEEVGGPVFGCDKQGGRESNFTPSLLGNITRPLIFLNHFLPEENKLVWVTIEEMRDRLVHCGVNKLLCVDLLAKSIRHAHQGGGILARTFMGRIQFYRPVEFAGQPGTPKDQCSSENGPPHRRLSISPECAAYFQLHLNTKVVVMLKNVMAA